MYRVLNVDLYLYSTSRWVLRYAMLQKIKTLFFIYFMRTNIMLTTIVLILINV